MKALACRWHGRCFTQAGVSAFFSRQRQLHKDLHSSAAKAMGLRALGPPQPLSQLGWLYLASLRWLFTCPANRFLFVAAALVINAANTMTGH